jgi:hypothetical protein
MPNIQPPSEANNYYENHAALLADSYHQLLQQPLLLPKQFGLAKELFEADFAVLAHTTGSDPLFNYANRYALALFEFSWGELIGMPSRYSAEPLVREEREHLLAEVSRKGYIDHYSGVRIAKSGKRFLIRQAVVWNVYDRQQNAIGQAACFKDWQILP